MKTGYQIFRVVLPSLIFIALLAAGFTGVNSRAQEQMPARTGYVNDFAGVLDEKTKQRLEVTLENVKRRSGVEFDVATVSTTGGMDIFDFSNRLAGDWHLGSRNAPSKSLLLVISVNQKGVFTQFSKSVQGDLPDGMLGEVGQRVREQIASGRFNEGVSAGVDHFVTSMAQKVGFSLQDIDQSAGAVAVSNLPKPTPPPAIDDRTTTSAPVKTAEEPAAVTTEPARTTEAVTAPPSKPTAEQPAVTTPTIVASNAAVTIPLFKTPELNAQPTDTRAEEKTTVTSPPVNAPRSRVAGAGGAKSNGGKARPNTPADDEAEAEEVELTLTLPLAERAGKLKEFVDTHPGSQARPRALELLISTQAGMGDEKLKEGDSKGGTEQLMLVISEAPAIVSDKLFAGVISQIPSNLFLRGQRSDAMEAARMIEAKFATDPRRLLALAGFYLGLEEGGEVTRIAEQAVKLEPNLAEAHRALGLGLHMSLRLDEAAAEYKRALELDPNSKGTRRSLADLDRGSGKTEAALALYREQLSAEPTDRAARAGIVLSLFDLGRLDEGNKELDAALQTEPRNLTLLTGAAYWLVAHGQSDRAFEFARNAVELEPRYTWAQIALARALTAQKNPIVAERAVRYAGRYGRFPTLDYELASVLASMGLYDEAAEVMQRSFVIRDGQIETRLAGRVPARAASFTELLAPERRASIFQSAGAGSADEAMALKALLTLIAVTTPASDNDKINEGLAVAAAKEFASGTDARRAYRQLYAANRLLQNGTGLPTVIELTEAARLSAEAALDVPAVTVAVQAEELREMRARSLAQDSTPEIPEVPRNLLSNMLRGRIEDLSGLALFNQDKTLEAVQHFQRAANILPEGTPLWRNALWHLGAALDQAGNKPEALNYYIKSFNAGEPEPLRRGLIEQLYRKLNGTLTGLDERIGASAVAMSTPAPAEKSSEAATNPAPSQSNATVEPTPSALPASTPALMQPTPAVPEVKAPAEPSPTPDATLTPTPSPTPSSSTSATTAESLVAQLSAEPLPTPKPTTVKVSGKVKDVKDNGIANVVVVLISPRGSVLASTTDADGNYSFTVAPSSQGYRIIPSKDGFAFVPVDKLLGDFNEDQKAVDFVGAQKP